jgi:DNA-binding response OmpR family regulator
MTRILVVDDEQDIRDVLTRFFTGKGYEVLTAESGEASLQTLEKEKVDAVLLDIRMPGLGGVETLRRIRNKWPALAVVMVSAEDDEDVARQTIQDGAFDYVVKPLELGYLERTLYLKLVHELIL